MTAISTILSIILSSELCYLLVPTQILHSQSNQLFSIVRLLMYSNILPPNAYSHICIHLHIRSI